MSRSLTPITWENIRFALVTFAFVLIAHAVAFLTHEYAHTVTAWLLGWMANPLALDYGHPTLYNFIFLGEVEDNVNYDPIFASGHGFDAALIALAGPFIGNGLLYVVLFPLSKAKSIAKNRLALSFVYWLALMCAGNVWSYVPIRAIASHADIALAAQGLGFSTWVLFPFLIVLSLYIVQHFFRTMFAACYQTITAGSANNLVLMIAVTAFWYFSFFGGDGITGNYGLVSQLLSIASRFLLFPLAAMYLASRYQASVRQASGKSRVK